ncbi:MAG TPA: hypothetical protein VGK94_15430 [Candidatus Polarisedimenticolia bacterium]|jgi:hypothetical protein
MSGKRTRRALLLIGALALTGGAAAIAYVKYAPRGTPRGQPPLITLSEDDLGPFERIFDEGASKKRVLVMLSPT